MKKLTIIGIILLYSLVNLSTQSTQFPNNTNKSAVSDSFIQNIIGTWKVNNPKLVDSIYMVFNNTGEIIIYKISASFNEQTKGRWFYNKENHSLIIKISDEDFNGTYRITKLSTLSFTIKNRKHIINVKRLKKHLKKQDYLNFKANHIYTDNYDQEKESTKLPWRNYESFSSFLINVTHLTYTHFNLVKDSNLLDSKEEETYINVNKAKTRIEIGNLFPEKILIENQDTNGTVLTRGAYEEKQDFFYPLETPDFFKVIGDKEIKTSAGKFLCTVVETINDFDEIKTRYYMIKNRPGIYAKIVVSIDISGWKQHEIYELSGIHGNFNPQNNKKIVGKWLLVKSIRGNQTVSTSEEFEFIDNGCLAIGTPDYREFFKWNYTSEQNTVRLIFNGEVKELNIIKLTPEEMRLKNQEISYQFIKFKAFDGISNIKNIEFNPVGYWILTNTEKRYSLLYLSPQGVFSTADFVTRCPQKEDYSTTEGEWGIIRNNITNKTEQKSLKLIFNRTLYTGTGETPIGVFKITTKANNNKLILSNDTEQRKYLKIDSETITKNNTNSGFEGIWKLRKNNGRYSYYHFKLPCTFEYSYEGKTNLYEAGLWLYNPTTQELFIGARIHRLEGFSTVSTIKNNNISFQDGSVLIREQKQPYPHH